MDENHQDKTGNKTISTEGKIWLPASYTNNKPSPVSPVPKKRGMNWGFAHKSFWEWLLLLGALLAALGAIAIPFAVTILGVNLTQQQAQLSIAASERQHQTDLQIARDQQQAAILQTYLDNIQDLLLNHHLLTSTTPGNDVVILARARTLTALQGLDGERKGRLLNFLYEAKLIGYQTLETGQTYVPIIDLSGANLSGANLVGAYLVGAYLMGVHLNGADLSHADLLDAPLIGADFSGADLNGANLIGADFNDAHLSGAEFSGADLNGANLVGADLSHADLSGADLSHAVLIGALLSGAIFTQQQLDEVLSCRSSILPKGFICNHL